MENQTINVNLELTSKAAMRAFATFLNTLASAEDAPEVKAAKKAVKKEEPKKEEPKKEEPKKEEPKKEEPKKEEPKKEEPKKEEPKKEEPKKEEPKKEEPKKEEPKKEESPVTLKMIKQAVSDLINTPDNDTNDANRAKIVSFLKKDLDTKSLSKLHEDNYSKMYTFLEGMSDE